MANRTAFNSNRLEQLPSPSCWNASDEAMNEAMDFYVMSLRNPPPSFGISDVLEMRGFVLLGPPSYPRRCQDLESSGASAREHARELDAEIKAVQMQVTKYTANVWHAGPRCVCSGSCDIASRYRSVLIVANGGLRTPPAVACSRRHVRLCLPQNCFECRLVNRLVGQKKG